MSSWSYPRLHLPLRSSVSAADEHLEQPIDKGFSEVDPDVERAVENLEFLVDHHLLSWIYRFLLCS